MLLPYRTVKILDGWFQAESIKLSFSADYFQIFLKVWKLSKKWLDYIA